MDIAFYIIFFLAISGIYLWLFIHDRKLRSREEGKQPVRAEPVTLNVNITNGGDSQSYSTEDASSSPSPINKKEKKNKTSEIPIEEPDRSKPGKDWLTQEITDSNL